MPAIIGADATRSGASTARRAWPFPSCARRSAVRRDQRRGRSTGTTTSAHDLVVGRQAVVRLLLQQDDGTFVDATASATGWPTCDCDARRLAGRRRDGRRLDLVAGADEGAPLVLRNNGDGTWTRQQPFAGVSNVRGFAWADLDRDADPDAVFVDAVGRAARLHQSAGRRRSSRGRRAGGTSELVGADRRRHRCRRRDRHRHARASGVDSADVTAGRDGTTGEIARWDGLAGAAPGSHRLIAADLDNNGALDLIASGGGESRIWLARRRIIVLQPLEGTLPGRGVSRVVDLNADGSSIWSACRADAPVRWLGNGHGAATTGR